MQVAISPFGANLLPAGRTQLHGLKDTGVLDLGKVVDDFRAAAVRTPDSDGRGSVERDAAYVMQLGGIAEDQVLLFDAQDADLVFLDVERFGQFVANALGVLRGQSFGFAIGRNLRKGQGRCRHVCISWAVESCSALYPAKGRGQDGSVGTARPRRQNLTEAEMFTTSQ